MQSYCEIYTGPECSAHASVLPLKFQEVHSSFLQQKDEKFCCLVQKIFNCKQSDVIR